MANTPEPNSEDPFSGIPFLGDIAKAMSGQGPINWDAARQFALLGATGGEQEPNVDPASRMALEALVPIARMHVGDLTGADLSTTDVVTCSRSQWAADTLDSYRPLFTDLATALSGATGVDEDATDPMAQMMAGLSKMMAPAMLGMAVGSMTGDLAQRCFGVHDLPIPRTDQRLKLIGANIDAFAAQWEIPLDEVRLWVLAHEFAGQAVLSSPNFATPLSAMVRQYVAAFRPDPDAVIEKLGGLDPTSGDPMEAIQQTLGDPAILLGAVSSEEQHEMEPRLDAAVAAVVGFTDWIVDAVSVRVVGGSALRIAEAVRRQRVEQSPSDVFVHRLLGIRLDEEQVHSGKQFVQGVVDRVGDDAAIAMLLSGNDRCPTPSEIAAPGLWIARVSES